MGEEGRANLSPLRKEGRPSCDQFLYGHAVVISQRLEPAMGRIYNKLVTMSRAVNYFQNNLSPDQANTQRDLVFISNLSSRYVFENFSNVFMSFFDRPSTALSSVMHVLTSGS